MNMGTLLKAFDTVMALRDVAQKVRGNPSEVRSDSGLTQSPSSGGGISGQIETHLTNVVVAALKEAFARDHARLELERAQLEEGRRRAEEDRRRAEEAMRQEVRRQAVERELGRLRLLAGTALVGWIAAVGLFVTRAGDATTPSRVLMALGWMLLLGALATAFTAQGRVGDANGGVEPESAARTGMLAIALLTAGLAFAAVSLMF